MGSKSRSGSARTEPKGRATTPRDARLGRRRLLTPRLEWALAIIVFVILLAVLFYVFRDVRATTAAPPAPVPPAATVAPIDASPVG